MGLFFGTDGLRGKINVELTYEVAYKIGNALSILKNKPNILIGSDTRNSNSYVTLALSVGAMSGGARVIDVGVVPTSAIAYLTRNLKFDYGVVISASHNSAEYNGIKIFNEEGYKLSDKEEERIERCFINSKSNDYLNIGKYSQNKGLVKKYSNFLISSFNNLFNDKKIVLDCANGASYKIAPEVFKKLGAKVFLISSKNDGLNINNNCGAVSPNNLAKKVVKLNADLGFAFDGDADRVIAVDEKGNIIDGDLIIYLLSKYLKKKGRLKGNTVVGTSHTNMAIERELINKNINFVRTDIGDKYVLAKMIEKDYSLGGEQSGHVILKDKATTGDGILTAIALVNMLVEEKINLSEAVDIKLYPQSNRNINVTDKMRVINNEELAHQVTKYNCLLGESGRVMIRASGTEPKIRIMVESLDEKLNDEIVSNISCLIEKINLEN